MSSKHARLAVPILGIVALLALFLALPEVPTHLTLLGCATCSASDPYLPLVGAGYFAALVAVALLFPAFPGRLVARSGLTWAVLLAAALTWVKWPAWCALCLVAHAANIMIWTIWTFVPAHASDRPTTAFRERLCLAIFAPVSVMALFGTANLTLMVYDLKLSRVAATSLKPGDAVPDFSAETTSGRTLTSADGAFVINFVSADCPFCEEQLPVLNAVATRFVDGPYRFVNISRATPPELVGRSTASEWVEDLEGALRDRFHVLGYPTVFVVGTDRKIAKVIAGVPDGLEEDLLATLGGEARVTPP